MGTASKSFALVLVALFLPTLVVPLPAVLADGELTSPWTFSLVPEKVMVLAIELQKGDRVEGSFNISGSLYHQDSPSRKDYAYLVAVYFTEGAKTFFNFSYVDDNVKYFFNYTADYSGDYHFSFHCSRNYLDPIDVPAPRLTINYAVVESTSLEIKVLSPLNQSYSESRLPLNFTVNKPVNWVGYSLDGKENVTINNNTTLSGLSNGLHHITVYANTTYGNVVVQDTALFTVEPLAIDPFPIILVAVSVLTLVGVVSLLIYRRHRKTQVAP